MLFRSPLQTWTFLLWLLQIRNAPQWPEQNVEDPRVDSLDLVTSRPLSSDKQGPTVPCSDLEHDEVTYSDAERSRCSPTHLEVSEIPRVDGEYSFVSETAGEGAECSRAPSADPELCVIAWAEMESVRGPWADCKGVKCP